MDENYNQQFRNARNRQKSAANRSAIHPRAIYLAAIAVARLFFTVAFIISPSRFRHDTSFLLT